MLITDGLVEMLLVYPRSEKDAGATVDRDRGAPRVTVVAFTFVAARVVVFTFVAFKVPVRIDVPRPSEARYPRTLADGSVLIGTIVAISTLK